MLTGVDISAPTTAFSNQKPTGETPTLTSISSSVSCGDCHYNFEIGGGPWNSQIYTHTAATVELLIDDTTNQTVTSTIQGTSFVPPSGVFAEETATGTVVTEDLTGTTLYLYAKSKPFKEPFIDLSRTYPTSYAVYFQFSAVFQTLTTLTGNGTSYSTCTGIEKT